MRIITHTYHSVILRDISGYLTQLSKAPKLHSPKINACPDIIWSFCVCRSIREIGALDKDLDLLHPLSVGGITVLIVVWSVIHY